MKTNDPGRDSRASAARRLRDITIGTAVAATVATGGLTAVAALSTHPSTSTPAPAAPIATTAPAPATVTTAAITTGVDQDTAVAPVVSAASGGGQASTGGS